MVLPAFCGAPVGDRLWVRGGRQAGGKPARQFSTGQVQPFACLAYFAVPISAICFSCRPSSVISSPLSGCISDFCFPNFCFSLGLFLGCLFPGKQIIRLNQFSIRPGFIVAGLQFEPVLFEKTGHVPIEGLADIKLRFRIFYVNERTVL